jgi:hypothetical protein
MRFMTACRPARAARGPVFPPVLALFLIAISACGSDDPASPPADTVYASTAPMGVLGLGGVYDRYTGELFVRGNTAYTTSWGTRAATGNTVYVWDVSGNTPVLADTVAVAGATTTGDVAASDDGSILVVATERSGGSIAIYSLSDPRHPKLLSRFTNAHTDPGVHTAEVGRVNGKLYAFLSIDPASGIPARLVTVDLSNPSDPREVFTKVTGNPYVHDTYVRDGLLFVALWNDGVDIWDVGGGGAGGSPENPVVLGNVKTLGGQVHNVWWYHDPSGRKRYAFVGQEGPGVIGSASIGDVHVIDVSDLTKPKEVAFFHVPNAGTHNFSVDEKNELLYAAYYNGGVQVVDVHGDLGTCAASEQDLTGGITRCNLNTMGRRYLTGLLTQNRTIYVWGVQYVSGYLYASDMLNGLWKMKSAK